jgi:hypothetical protein
MADAPTRFTLSSSIPLPQYGPGFSRTLTTAQAEVRGASGTGVSVTLLTLVGGEAVQTLAAVKKRLAGRLTSRYDDVMLCRFFRARNFDLDATMAMLEADIVSLALSLQGRRVRSG